jgi:hypothetical protein
VLLALRSDAVAAGQAHRDTLATARREDAERSQQALANVRAAAALHVRSVPYLLMPSFAMLSSLSFYQAGTFHGIFLYQPGSPVSRVPAGSKIKEAWCHGRRQAHL